MRKWSQPVVSFCCQRIYLPTDLGSCGVTGRRIRPSSILQQSGCDHFFDAWNLVEMQTLPCFRWDLAEPRAEQVIQGCWAVNCKSVCLTKRGLSEIGGCNELSQIYEAGSADLSGQARPNERKCLKRMISKTDSGESPTCRAPMPNPPSSEAKTGLFAHGGPFALDRLSSFGSLGRAAVPITPTPTKCLRDAKAGPLFGPGLADRKGLRHYSTIPLRSRLIETELDCSAAEGRTGAF